MSAVLNDTIRKVLTSGKPAHLATINPDGSPQITLVWIGLDGDEIVCAHMMKHKKVKNIQRDSRVTLSIETGEKNAMGLETYLVISGRARVTEGGAAELLQRLAHIYMGPDVKFSSGDNPPPGYITHITAERISGVGPWREQG